MISGHLHLNLDLDVTAQSSSFPLLAFAINLMTFIYHIFSLLMYMDRG